MANGWNSGQNREAMLRRVAIVLSSLPATVASQLLSTVDPESTKAVRRTMTSLSDVDPLERQRALQAFKISIQQQPAESPGGNRPEDAEGDVAASDGNVSRSEPKSRVVSSSIPEHRGPHTELSPLSFLEDVDEDDLVNLLAAEHPQAIAVVLASIEPAHAARVLPRLHPSVRSDALGRVGRLGEIPQAAAAEVAEHFKNSLAQQTSIRKRARGQRTLDAILAAMPSSTPDHRNELMKHQTTVEGVSVAGGVNGPSRSATAENASQQRAFSQAHASPEVAAGDVEYTAPPLTETAALDLSHRLRLAQHTWAEAETDPHDRPPATIAPPPGPSSTDRLPAGKSQAPLPPADQHPHESPVSQPPPPTGQQQDLPQQHAAADRGDDAQLAATGFSSTDEIHQHLLTLAPEQLCQALGKVDTRVAMLALCGLPNQVAESVLAVLPRAQARKVRIKMNTLDSLHLREIDEAKESVAKASLELSQATIRQVPVAA